MRNQEREDGKMRTLWAVGLMVGLVCAYPAFVAGAEENSDPSGKPEPKAVGENAEVLMKKVSLEFADVPLGEAVNFLRFVSKVKIEASQKASEKIVTLRMRDTTVAEVLRQIKDQCGCGYQIVKGAIRIETEEELKRPEKK